MNGFLISASKKTLILKLSKFYENIKTKKFGESIYEL